MSSDNFDTKQRETLDRLGQLLAVQIKVDIASEIRRHPHLAGDAATHAYDVLSHPRTVNRLVVDLAREEVEDVLARGEVPSSAMLYLAGYRRGTVGEG